MPPATARGRAALGRSLPSSWRLARTGYLIPLLTGTVATLIAGFGDGYRPGFLVWGGALTLAVTAVVGGSQHARERRLHRALVDFAREVPGTPFVEVTWWGQARLFWQELGLQLTAQATRHTAGMFSIQMLAQANDEWWHVPASEASAKAREVVARLTGHSSPGGV